MKTITVDDATYATLARAAADRGRTLDEHLAEVARGAGGPVSRGGAEATGRPLKQDSPEWQRAFDAMLSRAKPRNPNVDDSRASIYPVREHDRPGGPAGAEPGAE